MPDDTSLEENSPEETSVAEFVSDSGKANVYPLGFHRVKEGKFRKEAVMIDLNQGSVTAVFVIAVYEYRHHPQTEKAQAIMSTFTDERVARHMKHTKRKMKTVSVEVDRVNEHIKRRDRHLFDRLVKKLFGGSAHGITVTAQGDTDHQILNSGLATKLRQHLRKNLKPGFPNLAKLGLD